MKALNIPINIDSCKHITLEDVERREQRRFNTIVKLRMKKNIKNHVPLLFYIEGLKTFVE